MFPIFQLSENGSLTWLSFVSMPDKRPKAASFMYASLTCLQKTSSSFSHRHSSHLLWASLSCQCEGLQLPELCRFFLRHFISLFLELVNTPPPPLPLPSRHPANPNAPAVFLWGDPSGSKLLSVVSWRHVKIRCPDPLLACNFFI